MHRKYLIPLLLLSSALYSGCALENVSEKGATCPPRDAGDTAILKYIGDASCTSSNAKCADLYAENFKYGYCPIVFPQCSHKGSEYFCEKERIIVCDGDGLLCDDETSCYYPSKETTCGAGSKCNAKDRGDDCTAYTKKHSCLKVDGVYQCVADKKTETETCEFDASNPKTCGATGCRDGENGDDCSKYEEPRKCILEDGHYLCKGEEICEFDASNPKTCGAVGCRDGENGDDCSKYEEPRKCIQEDGDYFCRIDENVVKCDGEYVDPANVETCGATGCESENRGENCTLHQAPYDCVEAGESFECRLRENFVECEEDYLDASSMQTCGATGCEPEFRGLDCTSFEAPHECVSVEGVYVCRVFENIVECGENADPVYLDASNNKTCGAISCEAENSGDDCTKYSDAHHCEKGVDGNYSCKCDTGKNNEDGTCGENEVVSNDCKGGMTNCGTDVIPICVDLSSNPVHCGGCNVPCDGTCTGGVCQKDSNPSEPKKCNPNECTINGDNGIECVNTTTRCGSSCSNCELNLGAGAFCTNGVCRADSCDKNKHFVYNEHNEPVRCEDNSVNKCALPNNTSNSEIADCSAMKPANATTMRCTEGKCMIESCASGYALSSDGTTCSAVTCPSGYYWEDSGCVPYVTDCPYGHHVTSDRKNCEPNSKSACGASRWNGSGSYSNYVKSCSSPFTRCNDDGQCDCGSGLTRNWNGTACVSLGCANIEGVMASKTGTGYDDKICYATKCGSGYYYLSGNNTCNPECGSRDYCEGLPGWRTAICSGMVFCQANGCDDGYSLYRGLCFRNDNACGKGDIQTNCEAKGQSCVNDSYCQ